MFASQSRRPDDERRFLVDKIASEFYKRGLVVRREEGHIKVGGCRMSIRAFEEDYDEALRCLVDLVAERRGRGSFDHPVQGDL